MSGTGDGDGSTVPGTKLLSGSRRFDRGLQRLTDDARADEAAAGRTREHFLRRQAEEESSLVGVLLDLAEARARLVVGTAAGRSHLGVITVVAVDFCELRTQTGPSVVIPYSALTLVRPDPSNAVVGDDRPVASTATLHEHLASLAEDRPSVLLRTVGTESPVRGELRVVGRDVLHLRTDGDGSVVYVPVPSLAEVSATVSG